MNAKLNSFVKAFALPESLELYSIDGQVVFPLFHNPNVLILYIVTKQGDKYYKFGIEFPTNIHLFDLTAMLTSAVQQFQTQLAVQIAPNVDLDGGDLGRSDLLL